MDEEENASWVFIRKLIEEDVLSVDLQWSLFVAALMSYRHDSVLRPFPPAFLNGHEKDIKSLEKVAETVSTLSDLKQCSSFSMKALNLLKWVLDSKSLSLKTLDKAQFQEVRRKAGDTGNVPIPNYIFEVLPSDLAQEKFEQVRRGRQLLYGYHGSRCENFYSILHNGLASHMNKVSVFGEGTYLSSELSVSLNYSPMGLGWDQSLLGNKLSCVAVCEMIDDPAVKCQQKLASENRGVKSGKSRANAGNSEGGEVPEKYYVVQNNDVIRVKYLLVYAHKSPVKRSDKSLHTAWLQEHRFAVMMVVYFLILCIIGMISSDSFQQQVKKFWRQLR
ncbi:hypothetical protein CHS0354_003179 [Potamilus streckersoni]|uniref:Poly [ADP-ribose] polymerase n=1 Tax=Potamilus streckersoni TaxID=2493646 RepID=A0AAE0TFU6_9BIVA|nr:hypothetical protein CHS0354_003179 [Potamilus streckersoni]